MLDELFLLSQQFITAKNQAYRRYFIQRADLSHRMNIIVGARGVGKTTTLVQHLLDHVNGNLLSKEILYIQADHFMVAKYSLYEIAENFTQHGGKYLAIDEIHKYPDWSMELKSIYDTFPSLKIAASGSSALEINKGSHDLSRRALVLQMRGLSFREYLELIFETKLAHYSLEDLLEKHQHYAADILGIIDKHHKKILPLFADYLQYGYYPYYFEVDSKEIFYILLEQNIHVTLESDLVAIYPQLTGNSIRKIKQLLSFIAGAVPFIPNWNKIKAAIGIADVRTLKNYFKYLKDGGLIRSICKHSNKFIKMEAQEKILFDNTNLLYAISPSKPNKGTLRETFFLSMLSQAHQVDFPKNGDFVVDNHYHFEVGGRKKDFSQLKGETKAFVAADDMERGVAQKIPLWMFGFLY